MPENGQLPCSILRGGTSRGVFFAAADLPPERGEIEPILMNVFGSPDIRQINGLGGATSQTSKAAIVGPARGLDADVDYTFAQVGVGEPIVDWGGNCGNISSAVGPFAVDQGIVFAQDGVATVRIRNTNTDKLIVASVPVADGRAVIAGDYAIPGVPGVGARIDLEFIDPAGSYAGVLLPTGKPRDEVQLSDGRKLNISVVDAANPVVFALASELGARGSESAAELERLTEVTAALEEIRCLVAEWLGLVDDRRKGTALSPGLPKVGMVAAPADYTNALGERVAAEDMDVCGRLMSMQTAHRSYMVTGAICTAAAAVTEGTVVNEVAGLAPGARTVRIGHPYGVMDVGVRARTVDGSAQIEGVTVGRTARHILDGRAWVPAHLLERRSAAHVHA